MSDTNDSRIEKLLKAILGQEVQLDPRESRVERLLYAILTGGSHDEPTLSEMEDILLCILNGERYDGPTNSRINALLKVKANGGSYDEPRLSRIEELIYEWINGGDISTYTGTLPTTLQTVEGYLVGYKIWGNTVQNGTPTPENPIMPSGAGERTENLFDGADISGSINNRIYHNDIVYANLSQGTYTLTFDLETTATNTYSSSIGVGTTEYERSIQTQYNKHDGHFTFTFTIDAKDTGKDLYARFARFTEAVTITYTVSNIMFNSGSTALPYEPYGYKLPITSNDTTTDVYIGDTQLAKDEYVDSETNKIYKWAAITGLSEPLCGIGTYADSLDLSTGGLTRRIKKLVLTGEENITLYTVSTGNLFRIELPVNRILDQFLGNGICSHYRPVSRSADRIDGTISGGKAEVVQNVVDIVDNYATIADFKSYLAAQYTNGTPVTVWYVLAEPEISIIPIPSGLTGTIEGYLVQDGTPTPETPIYPTANGVKQEDGTYSIESVYITPTDPPAPLPQIPTAAGETTISYGGTGAQPEKVELKYR